MKAVDKALELIGEWKSAFGEQTGYKAINTVFSELEREGYHIPVTPVASAAFIKKAPEWVMADRCFMCRQDFNRFKGKLRVRSTPYFPGALGFSVINSVG